MEGRFWTKARTLLPEGRICRQEALKDHTTFGIGGPADYYAEPESDEELAALLTLIREEEMPFFLLGRGSNVLAGDAGFRGVVVYLGKRGDSLRVEKTGNRGILKAGSGVTLARLARQAQQAGLAGLEFASGIPGLLGGAIYMNAGAYGGEMSQIVASVRALTPEGTIRVLTADELGFAYRDSVFQHTDLVILEADLALRGGDPAAIAARMCELSEKRQQKQPLAYPNAGSVFKRPEGYYAGALISDCGLKGYRIGGAEISQKHAGFIVNRCGASALDVINLIRYSQERVWDRFHVHLEPELRLLGETGLLYL